MSVILVKYASRGRPERFLDGLENIYATCSQAEQLRVLVTADIDDSTMCNEEMRDKIESFQNCKVIYGTSKNKIDAINRDLGILPTEFEDWKILVNFSDDMRWTCNGWDNIVIGNFVQYSPDYSKYMAYLDPDTKGVLSTLFIAGKKWVDTFGFIYDPKFVSLFCDNLVEDCAKKLGKYYYVPYSIYQHFNSAYNYKDFPADKMFIEQQKIGWDVDQKTYHKIQTEGLDKYLEEFDLTKLN
jgi:hypothetical protein